MLSLDAPTHPHGREGLGNWDALSEEVVPKAVITIDNRGPLSEEAEPEAVIKCDSKIFMAPLT